MNASGFAFHTAAHTLVPQLPVTVPTGTVGKTVELAGLIREETDHD